MMTFVAFNHFWWMWPFRVVTLMFWYVSHVSHFFTKELAIMHSRTPGCQLSLILTLRSVLSLKFLWFFIFDYSIWQNSLTWQVIDGYDGASGPVDLYMYPSGAPCKCFSVNHKTGYAVFRLSRSCIFQPLKGKTRGLLGKIGKGSVLQWPGLGNYKIKLSCGNSITGAWTCKERGKNHTNVSLS